MKSFLSSDGRENDIDSFFHNLNLCLTALTGHASKIQDDARDILLSKCQLPIGLDGWQELERRAVWIGPRINNEVLTPFLISITNGITDNHNSKPALSNIANRSFDQWADTDVERFTGLANGIGDLFINAWMNYGDSAPKLTEIELHQKNDLRNLLEPQLRNIQGQASVNVLCAALREVLHELEHPSQTNKL